MFYILDIPVFVGKITIICLDLLKEPPETQDSKSSGFPIVKVLKDISSANQGIQSTYPLVI